MELHVAKYGEIKMLSAAKTPTRRRKKKILKPDVEKALIRLGIHDTESVRIPCPYCGTLYPSSVKFCKKCGEILPKPE
ncbi:MAG: zinc-ribbon domain-containing protein [Promethearchaeia archaeon]